MLRPGVQHATYIQTPSKNTLHISSQLTNAPHPRPPSDCPRLRFDVLLDLVRVINYCIVLYCTDTVEAGGHLPTALLPQPSAYEVDSCVRETTGWSTCSTSCGVGLSVRVSNDNDDCLTMHERRLCVIRPCGVDDSDLVRYLHSRIMVIRAPRTVTYAEGLLGLVARPLQVAVV